jgi:hypothetical protein
MKNIKILKEINNLNYEVYYSIWVNFWIEKNGFNPFLNNIKYGKVTTRNKAIEEDEKLEKAFITFYKKNKN